MSFGKGSRLARWTLVLVAVALPLTTLSLTIQNRAQASPSRISQLKAQLDKLNQQADQLVETYDQARENLARTQALLKSLRSDTLQAGNTLSALQQAMGARAAAAYMQGPGNTIAALFDGNPADAIDRMQILDLLAQQDGDLVAALRVAGQNYSARKAALEAAEREQAAALDALAKKKAAIEATVMKTQRLLDSLQAQDRAALLNAVDGPSSGTLPPITATGAVAKVLRYAYAQVGKPYAFGAAGPNAFDCSGLTMMAWAQAGVSLPHSSSAQYAVVTHIPMSQIQPGDLLFYYPGITHVAIYVGNGMQIAATHTGDYVRLQAIHSGLIGAGRP